MMARILEGFWPEKPAGAVALVDGWLFGEGGAPLRVTRRAMRQRDNINYKPDCPLCEPTMIRRSRCGRFQALILCRILAR